MVRMLLRQTSIFRGMGWLCSHTYVPPPVAQGEQRLGAKWTNEMGQDPSLKRCYGVDKKIKDCDWEYISTLKTVRSPREGMPRLEDLLVWLHESGSDDVWILLDIKVRQMFYTRASNEALAKRDRLMTTPMTSCQRWLVPSKPSLAPNPGTNASFLDAGT